MKKIEAIIRKSKFSEVRDALHSVEVNFFSYWDVTGVGNEKQGHVYRGITYSTSDIQRRYLSIIVSDAFVEKTIKAITGAANTNLVGDGKIFILPVEEAIRIRTGATIVENYKLIDSINGHISIHKHIEEKNLNLALDELDKHINNWHDDRIIKSRLI